MRAQLLLLKYVFDLIYLLRRSKKAGLGLSSLVSRLYLIVKLRSLMSRFRGRIAEDLTRTRGFLKATRALRLNGGLFFNFGVRSSLLNTKSRNYILFTRYAAVVSAASIFLNNLDESYRSSDEKLLLLSFKASPDGYADIRFEMSSVREERLSWVLASSRRIAFRILSKLGRDGGILLQNQNDADYYLSLPSVVNSFVKNFDSTWGGSVDKNYYARGKGTMIEARAYSRPYLYVDDILDALYLPNPADVKARKADGRRLGFSSSRLGRSSKYDEGTAPELMTQRLEWVRNRITATVNHRFFLSPNLTACTLNGRNIIPDALSKFARAAQKSFNNALAVTGWLEKNARGLVTARSILRGTVRLYKFFLFFESVVRLAIGCESKARARLFERKYPLKIYGL